MAAITGMTLARIGLLYPGQKNNLNARVKDYAYDGQLRYAAESGR